MGPILLFLLSCAARDGAARGESTADPAQLASFELAWSAIGEAFDAAALQEAIRGSQRGEVLYPEFVQRSCAAGCVGYVVWIAGRHVTYFGRRGEQHVERFPASL